MRAKIRHRGSRWYLSVVDDAGTEHGHGGFRTRREAQAKLRDLLGDRYVSPGGLTVAGYLAMWLRTREAADISRGTRELEQLIVRAYVAPHVGSVKLQSLGTEHLASLYSTLARSGGRGGRSLRGKTVRNVHGLLCKALGDAARWKPKPLLSSSPLDGVAPPARDDSVQRTAWTAEEVRRFLAVASQDRLGAIWRLALATGLRRGELLGLWWDDFSGNEVTVQRQVLSVITKQEVGRRLYVRETTKSRRARVVRFDEATAAALKTWKAAQAAQRLEFGPAWRAMGGLKVQAPWVVTEPDGFVIHPDTLLRRWKALVKRAGVTSIPLHGARHSYATLALGAGVRLDLVSRQLGHSSVGITADVYGHDDPEAAAEAAVAVGDLLG